MTDAAVAAPPQRAPLLAEMLREAERVLDHQVRALQELDDKVEHLLTLSVAVLLAAFGLAAFLAERAHPWRLYAVALAAGGLWNVAAVLRFARAYGLVDRAVESQVGPDSAWLLQRADDPDWPLERHCEQVLGAIHNSTLANDETAAFLTRERAQGLLWLISAVAAYAAVIATFLIFAEDSPGG